MSRLIQSLVPRIDTAKNTTYDAQKTDYDKKNKEFNINKSLTFVLALCLSIPYSIIACTIVDIPFASVFITSIITFALLIGNLLLLKKRKFRIIYLLITILGLVLLIYNAKYKNLPMTGVDWSNFNNFAKAAITNSSGIVSLYSNSMDLFSFFVALIYRMFGANIEQVYFFIYPLSLVIFRYTYKTVLLISKNINTAIWASIAITAWPINFIFSISVLREIPIQTLVIISFYNLVKYIRYDKLKNIVGALLCIAGASMMHSGMIGILIVYVYIFLQKKLFKNYKFIQFRAIIIACLCVAVISQAPVWGSIAKRFTSVSDVNDVVSSLDDQNKYLIANTQYISSVPQNLTEIILSAPYRLVMFTFSPFIWQVYDMQTIIAFFIDGIPQLIIIYTAYKVLKKYRLMSNNNKIIIIAIILSVLATYIIFSFGTNNYGTAMRHRTTVLPLLIVLVFSYYQYTHNRVNIKRDNI